MKAIKRMEPVAYIVFDNGSERKARDILRELNDMIDADYTDFSKNDSVDMALLEIIKERCEKEIDHCFELSDSTIRLEWNLDNGDAIDKLMHDLWDMMEEAGVTDAAE